MPIKRLFAVLIVALGLSGCASMPVQEAAKPPLLILVSIDGFRADYLQRGETPNLKMLADGGATGGMRPSFPSLTFPNHYTLVTGQRPDRNGIVANTMRDDRKPGVTFKMSNSDAVQDEFWWDGAKPVWTSAEEQGVKAAALFWPGSEAAHKGVRPTYWLPYQEDMPHAERIAQVMRWIDLPEAERPGLITMYFSDVDHAGHDHGPESPEVDAAIAKVDAAIGDLLGGLKARGLDGKVNIVIVSDHGMAKHKPEKFVRLADMVPADSADILGGQVAGFNPKPGHEAEVAKILLTPRPNMQCWSKDKIPARFHYGKHRRVPKIICLADVGGYLVAPSNDGWMPKPEGGSHGYDPAVIEMRAIFIANGPDIRRGVTLPVFDNVDVYSLETRLLRLKPERGDGSLTSLKPALK